MFRKGSPCALRDGGGGDVRRSLPASGKVTDANRDGMPRLMLRPDNAAEQALPTSQGPSRYRASNSASSVSWSCIRGPDRPRLLSRDSQTP